METRRTKKNTRKSYGGRPVNVKRRWTRSVQPNEESGMRGWSGGWTDDEHEMNNHEKNIEQSMNQWWKAHEQSMNPGMNVWWQKSDRMMESACDRVVEGDGKWIYRAETGIWQDDGKWLWQDSGGDVGVVDRILGVMECALSGEMTGAHRMNWGMGRYDRLWLGSLHILGEICQDDGKWMGSEYTGSSGEMTGGSQDKWGWGAMRGYD